MLTFNEKYHEYKKDGIIIPSVTQLLQEAGIVPDMTFADPTLGNAVHRATSLDDKGELDPDYDCEPVMRRVEAWRVFKKLNKVDILVNEKPMYSKLGFCGTVDRIVDIKGKRGVIDIKTGKIRQKSTILQLLAYKRLAEEQGHKIEFMYEVYLGDRGSYEIIFHKINDADWQIFLKILAIRNWRLK